MSNCFRVKQVEKTALNGCFCQEGFQQLFRYSNIHNTQSSYKWLGFSKKRSFFNGTERYGEVAHKSIIILRSRVSMNARRDIRSHDRNLSIVKFFQVIYFLNGLDELR